jgi:uncharacterized OB-fold protein
MKPSPAERASPPRPLPAINEMNRYFWCGGADGRLHILCCGDCGLFIHPYVARCPKCRSSRVAPRAVSGRGRVASFTVNHQPWLAGVPVPYVIALVELEEQSDIRLVSNLLTCPIEAVAAGMAVKVYFERRGDIFLPLFEPA